MEALIPCYARAVRKLNVVCSVANSTNIGFLHRQFPTLQLLHASQPLRGFTSISRRFIEEGSASPTENTANDITSADIASSSSNVDGNVNGNGNGNGNVTDIVHAVESNVESSANSDSKPGSSSGSNTMSGSRGRRSLMRDKRSITKLVKLEDLAAARPRDTVFNMPYFDKFDMLDPVLDFPAFPTEGKDDTDQPSHEFLEPEPEWQRFRFRKVDARSGTGATETALRQSGFDINSDLAKSLNTRMLVTRVTTNQTGKGKIRGSYCLALVGNGKGILGIGEGKGIDSAAASRKAENAAYKNLKYIPLFEGRTIQAEIKHKFHAVKMVLRSRPPGFGLRCSPALFEACRMIGIRDISVKIHGSNNKINTVKCFLEALEKIKSPAEIARERGWHLYELEQAYFKTDRRRKPRSQMN